VPDEPQLLTLATWPTAEGMAAEAALCQWAACLLWCPTCARLVTAGRHDPDWRRQFWANDIGIGLATNIWHMQLLRELTDPAPATPRGGPKNQAAAVPPPTPPAAALPNGLKELPLPPDDSGEWEWVPDEGDADAVGAQAEGDEGGR
jgi:hypothetical protein